MNSGTYREILRWFGWLACAAWLGYGIYFEIIEQDPAQFGFRAPVVEQEMKNCTSEDMKQRYECKEQAILSNERVQFVQWAGSATLVFAPPILVWLVFRRLTRPRSRHGDPLAPPPPPIHKWRVK